MLGLMKKDFIILKSSLKGMLVIIVMYVIMAFNGMFELSSILPLLGMILLISTISYDEQSNFNAYACTLPNGRRNIVKSKYLLAILIILTCSLFSVLVTSIVGYWKSDFNIANNISSVFSSLIGIIFAISLTYPFMFKFGAEKGRIYIFVLIFGGMILVTLLSIIVESSNLDSILNSASEMNLCLIFSLIALIMLVISYNISKNIMLKKEF